MHAYLWKPREWEPFEASNFIRINPANPKLAGYVIESFLHNINDLQP